MEEAREYAIGSMLLALENPSGHMIWMGEHPQLWADCPA